jgi:bifunctional polynucleotide phosphatase/kinase
MNDQTFTVGVQPTDGRPIAAFDYDGTLVRAREGRTHARDVSDWRWMRPCVPEKLVQMTTTHRIYVITDQSKQWKVDQILNVMKSLEIPVTVIVGGKTKKPETAWAVACLGGEKPAFYVGDAAGRPGDWSDCDRVFAERLGVPFHVATDYFPAPVAGPQRIPAGVGSSGEALILVGYPGSGKTTFAKALESRGLHVRLDGNELATPTAMVREATRKVAAGAASVIFDSTGGTAVRRKFFMDWAVVNGLTPKIVWINTDIETAMDRNADSSAPLPPVAFFVYRKHFDPPTEAEGAAVILIE